MGKRSNLYEIYFGPIGGHTEYDKLKNGPRGSMHSTGDPLQLDAEFEDEYELDDDFDEDDIDVLSVTGQSMAVSPTDYGQGKLPGTYGDIGYAYGMATAGLSEEAMRHNDPVKKQALHLAKIRDEEKSKEGVHTTTAVQGASPNLTYRNSAGGKATKTSMSSTTYPKLYTRPRVDMTASRYGTARAPLPRHYELDNNPIFSLDDLLDRHEVSLEKHSQNINRIRTAINEINDNFYDI